MNAVLAAPPSPHRLDLRLPSSLLESATARAAAFPSMHRPSSAVQEQDRFSGLSSGITQTRIPSRLEEMARRVHREGLPVARLWENNSALVSLGLNQRGKPGLWVVQKIH